MTKRLIFLNAPILTAYGKFDFELCSAEEAKRLIKRFEQADLELVSAVGHQATAEIMSEVLDHKIEMNRHTFTQTTDDVALIFRLKKRAREGEILKRGDIEEIGYEFGILTKLA